MQRIVVVGSANTDLVVPVARIPGPGETVLGGALAHLPGGKGANQAVAAARLGGQVTFIARVGDDAYGRAMIAGFIQDGIDTRHVQLTPGVASGVALIAVCEGTGENAIVVAPGANAHLCAADIAAAGDAFDEADVIVVSLEIPDDAVFAAIDAGAARQKPVLVNPAPARPLPPALLARIAALTPNQSEAALLGGVDALLAAGVGVVITTCGAAGAIIARPGQPPQRLPAPLVTPVDTVGAGDCFTGALAVEMARDAPIDDAVRFACAAAALQVTRPGAQSAMPTRAEVLSV